MAYYLQLFISLVVILVGVSFANEEYRNSWEKNCEDSDAHLTKLQAIVCQSIGHWPGCPSLNVSAKGDWPSQVVYYHHLLSAVADPDTCLNTTVGKGVVSWLDVVDPKVSLWWNTWVIFQVQYYDMPRKPGARIESPATLGRKCWAFAYLAEIWDALYPALAEAVKRADLSLDSMFDAYEGAVSETMHLCYEVMANCFVNASYDPTRNGTCPTSYGQFFVGYQWENGQRNNTLPYVFPSYGETAEFHADAIFAVNTALNYII